MQMNIFPLMRNSIQTGQKIALTKCNKWTKINRKQYNKLLLPESNDKRNGYENGFNFNSY